MSLEALLEERKEQLTPAEKRLVSILFSSPTKAAFYSATGLADEAGVHPATVVRFAKRLGFNGYPELRTVLQAEVIHLSEPAERIKKRLARAKSHQILSDLVESEISSLRELPNHINQNQIDYAASLLINANRIYIFAQGHASALAELMDRRLRRSGLDTVVLACQGRDLAERLLTINKNDVLLAFALHTRPPGLKLTLQRTVNQRTKSILISDSPSLVTALKPTIGLAAPRGEESEYQTLTVPMAVCNALILTLARLDEGRSLQVLDDLTQIMNDIVCEDELTTHNEDQP